MKKIIALVLVIALCCTISVGMTLAYLTDRDSKTNTFTVGNVDISLEENFTDNAPMLPGQEIEKDVWIDNVGPNDAWVWYTYAVPQNLEDVLELEFADNEHWVTPFEAGTYTDDEGVVYNVYACMWDAAVAPNAGTGVGLTKVTLSDKVDIHPDGEWYSVEGGVATKLNWNDQEPKIIVNAYGIQTEGFDTVSEAYNAYREQWAAELNEAPKVVTDTGDGLEDALENGDNVLVPPADDPIEKEADNDAPYGNKAGYIQKGGVFDGGNNTLIFESYGDDYGIMTYGGTIKNIKIDDIARAIVTMTPTEDVILENVHIGDNVLYGINTTEHATVDGLKLVVTDSTIQGWNSFDGGFASASFTDCAFEVGSYYDSWPYDSLVKPYINTVFTNVSFEAGYYLDLSSLKAGCTITLKNCTVDGTALAADVCGFNCDGTELFCVELPGDGRTLADCVIFE